METIAKHIGRLRNLINQQSDDSDMTDEYLYALLRDAKAILQKRKADSFHKLSEWDYQEYCIALCKDKAHNCDCIDVGCDVLKSKYPIPRPLIGRNREVISIKTLGGQTLSFASEEDVIQNKTDDFKKDKPAYWIDGDNKLVIWNTLAWKAIRVRGIFNDPTEWSDIKFCNEDGEEQGPCYDITDSEFPIDPSLHVPMYEIVLKALSINLQTLDDQTNDATDDIKA
jgi:hypothetical protein